MSRPPRLPGAPLFSLTLLLRGLAQGVAVLAMALLVFLANANGPGGEAAARAMAFVTLVLGNLGLVLTNKGLDSGAFQALLEPNRALGVVAAIALPALVLALVIPELRHLFGFAPLNEALAWIIRKIRRRKA